MTFTIEEISLLLEMEHATRRTALQALLSFVNITEDAELRSQLRRLGGKLYAMSDKEFDAANIDAWREDLDVQDEY